MAPCARDRLASHRYRNQVVSLQLFQIAQRAGGQAFGQLRYAWTWLVDHRQEQTGSVHPAPGQHGTGSVQTHVVGSNPANTPYISTTDPTTAGKPKAFGADQIEVNTRQLQRDINAGTAPQDISIVPPDNVREILQSKVDAAQARYNSNPSKNNANKLQRASQTVDFAVRDGECLIMPCVPAPYIIWPKSVTPMVPKVWKIITPVIPDEKKGK